MKRILIFLPLLACQSGNNPGPQKNTGYTELVMRPVGHVVQNPYADERVTLKVLILRTSASENSNTASDYPLHDHPVVFRPSGPFPEDAAIISPAQATNQLGIASVDVDVGSRENISFQVQVTAPDVEPITFTISTASESRDLLILSGNDIAVTPGSEVNILAQVQRPATISSPASAISDVPITVALAGGSQNGAGFVGSQSGELVLPSNALGRISFSFAAGEQSNRSYTLSFCADASCPGLPQKTVTIHVADAVGNAGGCQQNSDCGTGLFCDQGSCSEVALQCTEPEDCPENYHCNFGDKVCETGPANGCIQDAQCPSSFECVAEVCVPEGSAADFDLRGRWDTLYHFDLRDTLPGFVTALTPVIDFTNLVFASQLNIDVPIIGNLLESLIDILIDEYVPSYVPQVSTALGDVLHFFENLEIRGDMTLYQTPETPVLGKTLSGTEDWTSASAFVASLCEGGPAEFANDPECGRVDFLVMPSFDISYSDNNPTVEAMVEPFLGYIEGNTVNLESRRAALALRALVSVVLDLVISVATEGDYLDFNDFLISVIPCDDLQYALDDLACDWSGGELCDVPGIEEACTFASILAAGALDNAIDNIPVSLKLRFDANALIVDANGDQIAETIGPVLAPSQNPSGVLDGGTQTLVIFQGDFDERSWWSATRR